MLPSVRNPRIDGSKPLSRFGSDFTWMSRAIVPLATSVAPVPRPTSTIGDVSALLAEAFGIEAGEPPFVDLTQEANAAKALLANRKRIRAARDLGDGGLALSAFRMAEGSGIGLTLKTADIGQLFGEDQARYVVAIRAEDLAAFMAAAGGVKVTQVGKFGGEKVTFGTESAPMAELSHLYRTAFAATVGV